MYKVLHGRSPAGIFQPALCFFDDLNYSPFIYSCDLLFTGITAIKHLIGKKERLNINAIRAKRGLKIQNVQTYCFTCFLPYGLNTALRIDAIYITNCHDLTLSIPSFVTNSHKWEFLVRITKTKLREFLKKYTYSRLSMGHIENIPDPLTKTYSLPYFYTCLDILPSCFDTIFSKIPMLKCHIQLRLYYQSKNNLYNSIIVTSHSLRNGKIDHIKNSVTEIGNFSRSLKLAYILILDRSCYIVSQSQKLRKNTDPLTKIVTSLLYCHLFKTGLIHRGLILALYNLMIDPSHKIILRGLKIQPEISQPQKTDQALGSFLARTKKQTLRYQLFDLSILAEYNFRVLSPSIFALFSSPKKRRNKSRFLREEKIGFFGCEFYMILSRGFLAFFKLRSANILISILSMFNSLILSLKLRVNR